MAINSLEAIAAHLDGNAIISLSLNDYRWEMKPRKVGEPMTDTSRNSLASVGRVHTNSIFSNLK